ncbi:MAG: 23S rRNA (guanosine(2251)-2'-O)-methyltransferase RlmB [Verrucomicrobiota bacterium]|nr:23S rRNA (guanosine(2251)-2'-O)-methyltransferase RlmB [Verrucomicrobiota bacterium]
MKKRFNKYKKEKKEYHRPRKTQGSAKHTNWEKKIHTRSEEELFQFIKKIKGNPFFLILDQVQDPHNLGACLRSADGAGVHAVIIPKDNSVSITDVVRSISCGAAESIPVFQVVNISRVINKLQKAGLWIVGTTDKTEKTLYEIDLTGPLAIALGAEGKGLRQLTMKNCDFLCKIPMHGKVPCLNVSVATGICLFEAARQREIG